MKCFFCARGCDVKDGHGTCGMVILENGQIKERFPNHWSGYQAVHIESLPFFHVNPGSRSLLVGGLGCNFHCQYCINFRIALEKPDDAFMFSLMPEKIVEVAKKSQCQSIVFGVNEPAVSFPSIIETARKANACGLPVGCMTNGYFSEESAEWAEEIFSFINISLKSLSPEFYQKYMKVPDNAPVLRNIRRLAPKRHIEITTPVDERLNVDEINGIASFIAGINPGIPWHILRLLPTYQMKDQKSPDVEKINQSLQPARTLLSYIYFSNFPGSNWVNTCCPKCGSVVIERINLSGCSTRMINNQLTGGQCPHCGTPISLYLG